MAINTKYILAILLIGAFLISGCVAPPQPDKKVNYGFPLGSEAIDLSFLENQPPASVVSGEQFQIAVDVKNVGAKDTIVDIILDGLGGTYTVSPGFVKSTETLAGRTLIVDPSVASKSTEIPGGEEAVIFDVTPKLIVGVNVQESPIVAHAIFPFESRAITRICAKSRQSLSIGAAGICEIMGKRDVGTSAGPIKVTSIEQTVNTLIIHIENVGKGNPFVNVGENELKYSGVLPKDINLFTEQDNIDLTKVEIGTISDLIDCKIPEGGAKKIKLIDNKGLITCTTKFTEVSSESLETMVLTFNYGYQQKINTNIRVVAIPA